MENKNCGRTAWNRKNEVYDKSNEIIQLYREDLMSTKEIGKIMGCDSMVIQKILRENNALMNLSERRKILFAAGKLSLTKTAFKKGCKPLMTPIMFGEENPNWRGGTQFEPYGFEFNNLLKIKIKERDNYRCQCDLEGCNDILTIHHIDYDKKNNSFWNLITLCSRHNSMVNVNRKHWEAYFKMKMFIKEFFNPENIKVFENKKLVAMEKI